MRERSLIESAEITDRSLTLQSRLCYLAFEEAAFGGGTSALQGTGVTKRGGRVVAEFLVEARTGGVEQVVAGHRGMMLNGCERA